MLSPWVPSMCYAPRFPSLRAPVMLLSGRPHILIQTSLSRSFTTIKRNQTVLFGWDLSTRVKGGTWWPRPRAVAPLLPHAGVWGLRAWREPLLQEGDIEPTNQGGPQPLRAFLWGTEWGQPLGTWDVPPRLSRGKETMEEKLEAQIQVCHFLWKGKLPTPLPTRHTPAL